MRLSYIRTRFNAIVFLLWGMLFFYLAQTGNHKVFLRPQFSWLLYFGAVMLLILGIADIERKRRASANLAAIIKGTVILMPIVFVLYAKDAKLDDYAFRAKSNSFGSTTTREQKAKNDDAAAFKNTPREKSRYKNRDSIVKADLLQFSQAISAGKKSPGGYSGKIIETEGKVYRTNDFGKNSFVIFRFVITCCAADAQVYHAVVKDSKQIPPSNEWVRVTGRYSLKQSKFGPMSFIEEPEIEVIAPPDDEYLY